MRRRRMQLILVSLFVLIGLYIASGSGLLTIFGSDDRAYSDVPPSHYAYTHVQRLHDEGISGNVECPSGKFCPSDSLNRQTAAVWIIRTVMEGAPPYVSTSMFSDVDAGDWKAKYIEEFAERGITSGCGDDENGGKNFCPDNNVLRKHMAIFIARAFELPPASDAGFEDVRSGVYFDSINRLAGAGITSGCGDGTNFCPDKVITRAQAAIMLGQVLEWSDGLVEPEPEPEPERDTTDPKITIKYSPAVTEGPPSGRRRPAQLVASADEEVKWTHKESLTALCNASLFLSYPERGAAVNAKITLTDIAANGKWYCFRAIDDADNDTYKSKQVPEDAVPETEETDTTKPVITVSYWDGNPPNTNVGGAPELSASANESVTDWAHIGPLNSATCANKLFGRGTKPGSSVALDGGNNGKWYCFRAKDAANNWGFKSRQVPDDAVQDTRALDIIEMSKYPTAEEFLADLGISFKKDAPGLTRDNVIALYEPYLTERGNKILNRLQFYENPGSEKLLEKGYSCGACFTTAAVAMDGVRGVPLALYPAPRPKPDGWSDEWPPGGRYRRAERELYVVMHEVSHAFDYDNGERFTYFSWLNYKDTEGVGPLRQALRKFYANPPTSNQWTGFRHPTKPDVCMYVNHRENTWGGWARLGYATDKIFGEDYIIDWNIYHLGPHGESVSPAVEVAAELPLVIKNLSPELEEHYSLFFKDRQKIVQIMWALYMHDYDKPDRPTKYLFTEGSCSPAVQNASSSRSEPHTSAATSRSGSRFSEPPSANFVSKTETLETLTWVKGEDLILSARAQQGVADSIIDDTWESVALIEDASCNETAFENADEINHGSEIANPQANTQYCFRAQDKEGGINYINAFVTEASFADLTPSEQSGSVTETDEDSNLMLIIAISSGIGITLLVVVVFVFVFAGKNRQPKFR